MIEAYRGLDGDALCVANARALAAFCESPATPAAVSAGSTAVPPGTLTFKVGTKTNGQFPRDTA